MSTLMIKVSGNNVLHRTETVRKEVETSVIDFEPKQSKNNLNENQTQKINKNSRDIEKPRTKQSTQKAQMFQHHPNSYN